MTVLGTFLGVYVVIVKQIVFWRVGDKKWAWNSVPPRGIDVW